MRSLTDDELAAAAAALRAPAGDALRRLVFELNLGLPLSAPEAVTQARELGWLDGNNGFTELGVLVRDPLREYSLWLERDRALPSEDLVPALRPESYAGKRVVELGCGSGANLFSLAGVDARVVGLEPMPSALQMMSVLADMAGVSVPTAVLGTAEHQPFDNDSFDVALCYSAHQYMDIDVALAEMARVLALDGQMIIVGNSLRPFVPETVKRFAEGRQLGVLKYDLQAITNTVAYQVRGRRLLKDKTGTTTGMPVYPARSYMRRRLGELGFTIDETLTTELPSNETALFASRA